MTTKRMLLLAGVLFVLGMLAGFVAGPHYHDWWSRAQLSAQGLVIYDASGADTLREKLIFYAGLLSAVPVVAAWLCGRRPAVLWVAIFAVQAWVTALLIATVKQKALAAEMWTASQALPGIPAMWPVEYLPIHSIFLPAIVLCLLLAAGLRYLGSNGPPPET